MYSISDAAVSYTPGSGYTAAIPGCPVKIRWGEEFLAEVKAKSQSANSAGNAEKTEAAPRKELSKADIAELASKYNPNQMSQEEFDAFLEELEKRGVLSKDDMGQLGYQGAVVSKVCCDGSGLFLSSGSFSIIDLKDLPGQNPLNLFHSLADAGGDVLAWAKIQAILEHRAVSYTENGVVKRTDSAFSALLDALEAIQGERSR